MRTGRLPWLLVIALVAACNGRGCSCFGNNRSEGCNVKMEPAEAGTDSVAASCERHGGRCSTLFCDVGFTPSTTYTCDAFLSGCCVRTGDTSGPPPSSPFDNGVCNSHFCPTGCTCESVVGDGGDCIADCACGGDAGADADADAEAGADADAGADAGADAEADADAEAGADADPGTDPSSPCGNITCGPGCWCESASYSSCYCPVGACQP